MNRLKTKLPEWTRKAWTSHRAQEVWGPRLEAIVDAWNFAEVDSINLGSRRGALTFCTPSDLVAFVPRMARIGLVVVPLDQAPLFQGSYSSSGGDYTGGVFTYRIAITTYEDMDAWLEAWHENDNEAIGTLLGFPGCCQKFFSRVWVDEAYLDTTWPMAVNSVADGFAEREGDVITVQEGNPAANILLRWASARLVPNLPCSFACEGSLALAVLMRDVMIENGHEDEVEWLEQLLSMPMEWSALHGIAEIKTPLFVVSTRTDLTETKYVVQKQGAFYPEEGATGLVFPFSRSDKNVLTEGKSFAASIACFRDAQADQGETLWTDNGFSSEEGMSAAHDFVRSVFQEGFTGSEGGRVLDLGCGNGRLVLSLVEGGALEPCGIDTNADAMARAYGADSEGHWAVGDIRDIDEWPGGEQGYEVAVFMPGRFDEEWSEEEVERVVEELGRLADRVLLYCYSDHVTAGGLQDIWDRYPILESTWGPLGEVVHHESAQAVVVTIKKGAVGEGISD